MGEVYRARDARLGRDVAVKVLPSDFAANADRLARFEQEARATGSLNHPNILAIHDIGAHDGLPYIVSELLEGQTVRDLLADGALPIRKAADLAAQAARGLAAAHERGIVHRDLKPENLFVTRDGRVKILDFGLAKLTRPDAAAGSSSHLPTTPAGTEAGIIMGTVGYMAPEQVRGKAADPRADLFALGAILYEMLSGRRAFAGETAVETMHAILKVDPPDLVSISPAIPPALDRIVRHCLEKNPDERLQSARDVAFYLEALPGLTTPAAGTRPAEPPGRGGIPARRLALATLAVLVVAAALAAGALYGKHAAGPPVSAPVFNRLTFRHGFIPSARFTHDGQSVIYSATWDGDPIDVFLAHPGTPEARSLGLVGSNVLAISPSDELAISKIARLASSNLYNTVGTLSRMDLTGNSPRAIVEQATYADWAPDGQSLAVVRDLGDRHTLEYPIGKVLYETQHSLFNPRISRDGTLVALWESYTGRSTLIVCDRKGAVRTLSPDWSDWWYLSWSPDGREIWFGATSIGYSGALYAVDLAGHQRLLFSGPGQYDVQDVSHDGRALVGAAKQRLLTTGMLSGWTLERNLSWFDGTEVVDIGVHGDTLLLFEDSEAGGPRKSAFLQRSDGAPPVRLGEGHPLALSPDGRWALTVQRQHDPVLLPIGTGEPKTLSAGVFEGIEDGRWLPDGKGVIVLANEPGHRLRLYLLDLQGGAPKPFSDEGLDERNTIAVAPDGRRVAAAVADGPVQFVPTAGGTPERAPGSLPGDRPITWSDDGRSLFVYRRETPPARIIKIDVRTGRRENWRELPVRDLAGIATIDSVVMSPDGRTYGYSYQQFLTDLYIVDGLR
jgi:Tol biopolymer transport system component